jgi:hypothetical protein
VPVRFSLACPGTPYRFHRLRQSTTEPGAVEWAVSRAGEFVGLMTCADDLSPMEFAACCVLWIGELLSPTAGAPG